MPTCKRSPGKAKRILRSGLPCRFMPSRAASTEATAWLLLGGRGIGNVANERNEAKAELTVGDRDDWGLMSAVRPTGRGVARNQRTSVRTSSAKRGSGRSVTASPREAIRWAIEDMVETRLLVLKT